MSILATIISKIDEGLLHELHPRSSRDFRYRALYLTQDLRDELDRSRQDLEETLRISDLVADLEVFINRRLLHPEYLFGLSPKGCGVWEIRSLYDPQIRVFGMFMAKDRFVATHLVLRGDLGQFQSREWNEAKRRAKAHIRNLFNPYEPMYDSDINKLISGAMNEKYFRS